MRALFAAKRLRRRQRLVKIVASQHDLHRIAAKDPRLVDLLLRRRHRHENRALHPEMPTGKGHTLRMVARTGADEMPLIGRGHPHLAHRIERAAQFIAAHRCQIFALQPDLGAIACRQMIIALQRRLREQIADGFGGGAGLGGKITHAREPYSATMRQGQSVLFARQRKTQ